MITIDETSIAYVRVDREHLENEISLDENYSAIPVKRHVSESAKRALDENLATNKKEIRRWKKAAKKHRTIMPGIRVRRNSPRISKEMRELQKENETIETTNQQLLWNCYGDDDDWNPSNDRTSTFPDECGHTNAVWLRLPLI